MPTDKTSNTNQEAAPELPSDDKSQSESINAYLQLLSIMDEGVAYPGIPMGEQHSYRAAPRSTSGTSSSNSNTSALMEYLVNSRAGRALSTYWQRLTEGS